MQIVHAPYTFGSNIFEKAGGAFMDVARAGVGLLTKVRGDTDNQVVTGAPSVNYANLAVYGTLAALALLIAVKPARTR